MENPCKKLEVFDVGYHQLDTYIAHCLGLGSFEGSLDSPNDQSYTIDVVNHPTVYAWRKEMLEKILEVKGCESWSMSIVLDYMCHLGFLEPGKYIVHVSW